MFVTLIIIFSVLYGTLCLSWLPFVWRKAKNRKSVYWNQIFRFLFGFGYGMVTFWVANYDLTFSAFMNRFLLIFSILTIWDVYRSYNQFSSQDRYRVQLLIGSFGILVCFLLSGVYPFWIAEERYQSVQATVTDKPMLEVNDQHITTITPEFAIYEMKKLMGRLPDESHFELGQPSLRKMNGKLYWVSPLEFRGISWSGNEVIPGYMKLSAEDTRANAEFVKAPMSIVPSGSLQKNADRVVRSIRPQSVLMSPSFEPDESGKPFYVYPYGHYEKNRNIRKVDGAIMIDPDTGKTNVYSIKDVPLFVDQVIPMDLAFDQNIWFGKFRLGFWESILSTEKVQVPRHWGEDQILIPVYDKERQLYWTTDHVRDVEETGPMVGYSMMNARTGELTFYNGPSGMFNGITVQILTEKIFKEKSWKAGRPKLYYIRGEYTWVVEMMDSHHIIRKIVFMNADDEKILGYGDTKGEALNRYQYSLSTNRDAEKEKLTNHASESKLIGKVTAVHKYYLNEQSMVQFMIEGNNHIFTVGDKTAPYAIFLEKGHIVEIDFIETTEVHLGVTALKNQTLGK